MLRRLLVPISLVLALGCEGGSREGGAACGIAALAGPTILLEEFRVPGQTLANAPSQLPEHLVVRVAAGPAYRAVVGRADTNWVIGVEGTFPNAVHGEHVLPANRPSTVRGGARSVSAGPRSRPSIRIRS